MHRDITRLYGLNLLLILAAVSASGGCNCVHTHKRTIAEEPTPIVDTVDVGGAVANPRSIEIPDDGLTLRQAIIRAGGLRLSAPGVPGLNPNDAFVVLRRGTGLEGKNFHFPLLLVEQDLAGEIQLAAKDLIRIVDVGQTSLNPGNAANFLNVGAGSRIAVRGMVRNSNVYLKETGDTIRTLRGKAGARAESTVVALSRMSITGIGRDLYVLPLGGVRSSGATTQEPASNEQKQASSGNHLVTYAMQVIPPGGEAPPGPRLRPNAQELPAPEHQPERTVTTETPRQLLDSTVADGDELVFTRLEGIPIVLTGLAIPYARERAEERFRRQARQHLQNVAREQSQLPRENAQLPRENTRRAALIADGLGDRDVRANGQLQSLRRSVLGG